MTNKNIFSVILLVALIVIGGCKDDKENGIIPSKSTISGVFINEVYSSNPDWIELYNSNDKDIDLSGCILQDNNGAAKEYHIPTTTKIKAKSFLVIEDFEFGISSSKGDAVKLLDNSGKIIDEVNVPILKDNKSYGRTKDGGEEWKEFEISTKGKSNEDISEPITVVKLFINEVMAAPAGDEADFIEIYNGEDKDIDLGGYILQDDKGKKDEFVIPKGTIIKSKGLVVFSQVDKGDKSSFSFGISSKGDKIILLSPQNEIVDQVSTPKFGDVKGQSYSRIGNGGDKWQIVDNPTKGTDNLSDATVSYIGKLVVNEIYTFGDQKTKDNLDWIELYNTTDEEINLEGLYLWESGGRSEAWKIPSGKKIGAKGYLVIEADKENLYNEPTNYPSWGLSKGQEEYVVLAYSNMAIIDSIKCPSLNRDESYGRIKDGDSKWQIFAKHTKGEENKGKAREKHVNTTGFYINEVYHDNQKKALKGFDWDTERDFIEFYNSNDKDLDISGWEIYDDTDDDSKKYTIPKGTSIPAKGYLVYDVYKKNKKGPKFGLGVSGDWVFVYKAGKSELVDVMEVTGFPKDAELRGKGYTCGRKTDGAEEIVIFKEASKGTSNNGKATIK